MMNYGILFVIIGILGGSIVAQTAGLDGTAGMLVGGACGIGLLVVWTEVLNLPTTAGFGAPHGPGPSPPKWINEDRRTAIYDAGDEWRAIHPESGIEATAEDPQEADDELVEQLREHGWVDE